MLRSNKGFWTIYDLCVVLNIMHFAQSPLKPTLVHKVEPGNEQQISPFCHNMDWLRIAACLAQNTCQCSFDSSYFYMGATQFKILNKEAKTTLLRITFSEDHKCR